MKIMIPLLLLALPAYADGIDVNTKLMMHGNGSLSDVTGKTVTGHGSVSGSAIEKKFGSGSIKFTAATSDFVTVANSSDFDFGSGDFTIDWWAYEVQNGSTPVSHISRNWDHVYPPFILSYNGTIWMSSNGTGWDLANAKTFGSPVYNTWSHLAIQRDGNTFSAIRDCVLKDQWTSSATLPTGSADLAIGKAQYGNHMNGYIDELRVSNGIARYDLTGKSVNDTVCTLETQEYSVAATSGTVSGTPPISITANNNSDIQLIDTSEVACDHYQLTYIHAVSDIETPPDAQAGAALTVYVSTDEGATYEYGPNYNSVGQSNFAGEANSLFNPQPFALGVPQTLNMGFRLSVDSGDYATYGTTGHADIYNAGGNTVYTAISYKGAIGGNANALRASGTLPASSVGNPWFPNNGTQYFHWPVPLMYAGHYDGSPGDRPNAFQLKMNGGGNEVAIIESGTFKLRCMD